MTSQTLAQIALEEYRTRRANFIGGLRAHQIGAEQASDALAHWAALACYFGSPFSDEERDHLARATGQAAGCDLVWIDLYPRHERADSAMQAMAGELRRATLAAAGAWQADPHNAALRHRLRDLIRLDSHLHERAALPHIATQFTGPLTPDLEPGRKAA